MMNACVRKCLVIILLGMSTLSAQEVDLRKKLVLERFESDTSVQWVRYFRGFLDQRYALDILLASDGEQLHGAMRFERDSLVYYLDGVYQDSTVMLEETDESGSEVAFVTGRFDGIEFTGYWKNKRGDIQFPLQFVETRQSKKLKIARPQLFSFDTKQDPWKGHWSLYTDGASHLFGSFIDAGGQWYQVRSAGWYDGIWKIMIVGQENPYVRVAYLNLQRKRLFMDLDADGYQLKKWREYPVFSMQHAVSYTTFSSLLKINQEYGRLRQYTEGQLPVVDELGDSDLEISRAYALRYDFFMPIYLDEKWIIGQWVRSFYTQDKGHTYDDFLFHFRQEIWEVFKPEKWSKEAEFTLADLQRDAPPLESLYGEEGLWQLISEYPEAAMFDRVVYTPYGTYLVNHYNHYSGMMLLPINHPAMQTYLQSLLKPVK
jgi:hypothetical protein